MVNRGFFQEDAFERLARWRNMLDQFVSEATGYNISSLQEPGYEQLGGGNVYTGLNRQDVNDKAMRYFHTDPTARHLIMLHNAYVFGRGASIRSKDEATDEWINMFWNSQRNRHIIGSARGQWNTGREAHLNGEVFFALYTSALTGRTSVRLVEPREITDIIAVDGGMPVAYIREYSRDGKQYKFTYPDWRVYDTKITNRTDGFKDNTIAAMYHFNLNDFDGRGISTIATSIPWIKALKGFMEDRAVLTLALSTIAFVHKVKGNAAAVARVVDQVGAYDSQQRYGPTTTGKERKAGANTLIQNEGSEYEQLKVDSGASNAYQDMRMFRQQAGIGSGIFEHYLGDPSTGNLATATAMELPMLKTFEFEQQIWGDVIEELLSYVLYAGARWGGNASVSSKYKIKPDSSGKTQLWELDPSPEIIVNFPPIVQRDVGTWMNALGYVATAEGMLGQQIVPPMQKMETALKAMGYTDELPAILQEWSDKNFIPDITPNTPAVNEAVKKIIQHLKKRHEAVGNPLPPDEAKDAPPVTKSEITDTFIEFEDWPTLDELLGDLGVDKSEVE